MGQVAFEHEVYERLQGRKHLQPVFSGGCYDITRRLREYDPALFVVWNPKRRKMEIHSLNNIGSTYGCDVPNNRLDARVETVIRMSDLKVRGQEIFKEIDALNERLEKSMERQRRDEIRAIAGEMKPYFAKLGWEGI